MHLLLVSVNVNRNAHPNIVFAVLQNEAGESVSVRFASIQAPTLTI